MENLDPDILRSIIRVLKPSALELCALSTLSLKWKEACYSDEFWLEVDVDCSRKQNIYNWGLEMLSERLKSAEYLSFRSLHFPVIYFSLHVIFSVLLSIMLGNKISG